MTLLAVDALEAAPRPARRRCAASRFTSPTGEIVALVGANGAGKTTLLRAHRRRAPACRRHDRLQGRGRQRTPRPPRASAMGIALVPEGRRLFARLTVEENLLLARSAPARRRVDARRGDGGLPDLKAAASQPRRHTVGRRAAGDRDRPRADDEPASCCCSTRSRSGSRRSSSSASTARSRRLKASGVADAAGRAGPQARHGDREPRPSACSKARSCIEGRPARADPRGSHRGLLRPRRTPRGGAARDPRQPNHPGHPARRLLRAHRRAACRSCSGSCGSSTSRTAASRCSSAYRALRARRPFRRLAVPRPLVVVAGDGAGRLGAAAPGARAQRSRRAPGAGAVDLRAVDHHRQPPVRALRRRHPLARALYRRSRPTTAGRSPTTSRSASSRR